MGKAYCEKAYINIQNLTKTRVDKEFVKNDYCIERPIANCMDMED